MVFGAALLTGACASTPARSSVTVPLEIPGAAASRGYGSGTCGRRRDAARPPEKPPVTPASQTAKPAPPPPASAAAVPAPAAPPPVVTAAEPPRTTPPPELRPAGPAGRTPTAAQVRDRVARAKQKLDSHRSTPPQRRPTNRLRFRAPLPLAGRSRGEREQSAAGGIVCREGGNTGGWSSVIHALGDWWIGRLGTRIARLEDWEIGRLGTRDCSWGEVTSFASLRDASEHWSAQSAETN